MSTPKPLPIPILKIRYIQFLASISVMYIHAGNWQHFKLPESGWGPLLEHGLIFLSSWAVPFFFASSAFLFFRDFSFAQLLPKWKRRVTSLLVPYLLWNAIYYVYHAGVLRLPVLSDLLLTSPAPLTLETALHALFLHEYATVMWFIKVLIVFTLLAPLFYAVLRQKILGEVTLFGLFALMTLNVPFPIPGVSTSWNSLFFYALGAYLVLRRPSLAAWAPPPRARRAALFAIPLLLLSGYFCRTPPYFLLLITALWIVVDADRLRDRFAFSALFFVFGGHLLIMQVPEKLFVLLLPHTDAFAVLAYAAVPLVALPILLGVAYLLHKYLPGVFSLLTGGRGSKSAAKAQSIRD